MQFILHRFYYLSSQIAYGVMGFNATFNNISAISWRSVLLVEETGVPGEYAYDWINICYIYSH
jgi:hypothetical protein